MNISRKNDGFTLIEVIITVAIVAILAAVALPGYQDQIRKARRADVMDLLTDCAAAQARFFSTESPPTYLDEAGLVDENLCNGNGLAPNTLMSKEGYYQITLVQNLAENGVNCLTGDTTWCFILVATPPVGSPQTTDALCQRWTIDHRGRKTANSNLNASDAATDTTAQCWRS